MSIISETKRVTVPEIRAHKNAKPVVCLTCYHAHTARLLEVPFDWVITAQQAGSYKPSHNNFKLALERIALPPDEVLHCAQSIYHDVIPARALGLATVWVNRRGAKGGGATKAAQGRPDLVVPDLKSLAEMAT